MIPSFYGGIPQAEVSVLHHPGHSGGVTEVPMDTYRNPLTRHAAIRARQRGVSVRLLDVLIAHADCELHAGAGCSTLRLSRHAAGSLVTEGVVTPDEAARMSRVVAIDGRRGIVSVLRAAAGRRGRRYRRQCRTRSARQEAC